MLAARRISAAGPAIDPALGAAAPERLPATGLRLGRYELRFARSAEEVDAALRLRFAVFNVELGEGLPESHKSGRDADDFDAQFHHLLVLDHRSGEVVGTYRLQTSEMAAAGRGFYAAGEFDLSHLPAEVRDGAVELGRACIAREHRNTRALFLLWRGVGAYLLHNEKRFLFGCCSLTSQEPRDGIALARHLERRGAFVPGPRVPAQPGFACPPAAAEREADAAVPKLFGMYLALGARVCSEPAIDRAFGTIDFLVLLDAERLGSLHRIRFLGAASNAA